MRKLLSLPPNLVECFHDIENASREEWFCTNDPVGSKLGSGGGTTWLLQACHQSDDSQLSFEQWLGSQKRILLHAGGQSRRLPGYAPSGKILTPIPVFRWKRGQQLNQNLLSLQVPLYEQIMQKAPSSLHTLVASGDVYIRCTKPLQDIPEADVVCYGLWVDPNLAKNHGVFVSRRDNPGELDYMLQKPSLKELGELMQHNLFLMDIGIWLLSDKAVNLMVKHSMKPDGSVGFYDMYSEFGLALGNNPRILDEELNNLSVAILPLPGGEFYHYGTSREMISSTLAVQNCVIDQRAIMHHNVKPHPAMFVQNADIAVSLSSDNSELWIENSFVGSQWKLEQQHIITGVPANDWSLQLNRGMCIDVVPMGDTDFVARPYGFNDAFRGPLEKQDTLYLGVAVRAWLGARGLKPEDIEGNHDLQAARIFPVCQSVEDLGKVIRWMTTEPYFHEGADVWKAAWKMSADEISAYANLRRLTDQRNELRKANWELIARNHNRSVFYQLNLEHAAQEFAADGLALPEELDESSDTLKRISDSMFRARVKTLCGKDGSADEEKAFALMREGLTATANHSQEPKLSVYSDQIVWSRSPVRIDVAGGWTDTPPYSLLQGGNVVNLAIELNGQPPLQVYVKPSTEYKITLRSIDLGAVEVVNTYEELSQFNKVGSPFSIPKAALVLAGFHPDFCATRYSSLQEQLRVFGSGIEMTTLSAIPAGSGLGTSSILASTVLGGVNEFCGLGWNKYDISNATLILEQLLTTGGGWQDQYGGVLSGVKLLQTLPGWQQQPLVRWLPDHLFTQPDSSKCHLLYYTGITRTAKGILAEIVRGMFLNNTRHLDILTQMREHALQLSDIIQRNDFDGYGRMIRKTWAQNQALDSGTNPESVQKIISLIDDYCLGYKLPGAGGGGYLYMVAKDEDAAARIRKTLSQNQPNAKARFVEMSLSQKGLEVSKS